MEQQFQVLPATTAEHRSNAEVDAFGDFLYYLAATQYGAELDALLLGRLVRLNELSGEELGDILARAPGAASASHIAYVEPLYNEPGAVPEMRGKIPHSVKAIYFLAKPGTPALRAIEAIRSMREANPHGPDIIIVKGGDGKARTYKAGAVVKNYVKGTEVKQ